MSKKILKRYNNLGKIFKIESAKKKRGPKKKKETKKAEHNAWAKENIISKIQRHYLNFIVSFLNDSILSEYKNDSFYIDVSMRGFCICTGCVYERADA